MGEPNDSAASQHAASTIATAQQAVTNAGVACIAAREHVLLARALRAEARLLREARAAAAAVDRT
jgi:hypothetical protein